MAYTTLLFEHPKIGDIKEAPVGFSWTTWFFWFIPALTRGDFIWAAIMFVVVLGTGGLAGFVFPFIYNSIYLNSLIKKGYKAVGDIDLVAAKLGMTIPQIEHDALSG